MHSTTNNNVCLSPLLQNSGTEEKRLTSTERENISKEKALTKTGIMFENQHLLNDWKKEKNKMGEFEEENNIINDDEDGFEELRDFQLLLMPAARQSAARRFNSIPSPLTANKINEQQKQQKIRKNCENTENIGPIPPFVQRRQRNINNNYILNRPPPAFLETTIKTTNKFPLIDEDLLMLISRNNNNNKNISINGTSPSNLCRLITNVSECKWTTPTTNLDETQNLEKIKIEEKPKKMTNLQNSSFNSNNLIINQNPKNNKNFKKSKTYSSPISSNKIPKISKTSSSHFNSVIVPSENSKENNILINQKNKELNDSSTNCDCTSIAFAAFRRRQLGNNNSKNKKLNKNDEEDIYQKIDSSSSKSFKNVDSGISSSPCSSGGSIEGDKNNLLPPPPLFEDKNQVKEAVVLLSRRRQTLNYLLGNIVKFLLIASPPKRTTKTNKIKKNKKDDNKKAIIEIKSTPSTSSPRNNTENVENVDNKQSPRWRADAINEALPAFKKEQQLQKQQKLPSVVDKNQRPTTSLLENTSSPLANNSLHFDKISNKIEQNSIHPLIETPNTSLPSIQTNNEKRKINIEEDNKYLNGSNNEIISSTFLPQTLIQTSALKAQQQIKNNSITTTLNNNQKNNTAQNDIIIHNSELQQINNNNSEFEKQFSTSLSPPPCYQQAANSLRLSPIAGRLAGIPRFHFPMGRPIGKAESDAKLNRIRELFQSFPDGKISFADFDELCRRMDMAIYTKKAVFDACCRMNGLTLFSSSTQTENEQNLKDLPKIDFNQFIIYWNRMCSEAHDEATRFIFTLNAAARPFNSHCLRKEDFLPILMDLILTHPGLHFLKEAPQFYSKYCEVVIVRIFWNVNRSWSGRIIASELRRSNFLQTLKMLDDITDINRITDYFSYEHFYVTYCKFWELDTDHDMVISRDDMKRHCNGALTDRIIDRIFSAAVLRTPSEQKTISGQGPVKQQPIETIGFEDFVCFLLAEEDKRHPTSVEYWFRCIDLDGDGQISLYEMEYFYEAIEQKLNSKNMETLALRDVICNLLDSISSSNGYSITRSDLKKSGLAHRFFNTFVNWIKYVDQESSDGERASVKTTGDKEISDWEVFCLTEYELLMSESEQISNEEEEEEDGVEDENIDLVLDEDDELESSLTTALLNEEREQRLHGFLQNQQKQQQQNGHLTA